ncbi:four helix bundle protein [Jiulongibacter sediminis]|uniref:four helix bundle protein n=1 Tax=Jiulongibacter sediminis TaxID=1605367 RepID=UPI0026EAA95E|nr:four helix bundle protein [Jiulongibacter sediminis]
MKQESNFDFSERLKKRTKTFAVDTIKFSKGFTNNDESFIVKKQLIRSSTSTAANYRAACRGRSKAEFYSKLCISLEEADESLFWYEIIEEAEIMNGTELENLKNEAAELVAILTSSRTTLQKSLPNKF